MTNSTDTSAPSGQSNPSPIRSGLVALDTPDLTASTDFWAELLSVEVASREDDWVTLTPAAGGLQLAFQLAPDHIAPTWPDNDVPQQIHLDLYVADLDVAERHAVALGARPVRGPDPNPSFRVYLDPAGHPFCLCLE